MKLKILHLVFIAQVLAFAIPTPTPNLAIEEHPVTPAIGSLVRRQGPLVTIFDVWTAVHEYLDHTHPQEVTKGPDADKQPGDPGSYQRLKPRTTELGDWVEALYQLLKAKKQVQPGGKNQIEDILKQHMEFLPPGWQDIIIPSPLPGLVINSNQTTNHS